MKSFLALLTVVQLAIATPLLRHWDNLAEKHAWAEIPQGWEYRSAAPKDHMFDLKIALKQDRMGELHKHLLEISDPYHSRYGKHLTQAEVNALIAPHPTTVEIVESWLGHHEVAPESVIHRTPSGDFVTLRISVGQAERMLGASYNVYHHSGTSEEVVRTLSYSLPQALHSHVNVVAPTTYFGTLRSMRATSFLQDDPVVNIDGADSDPEDGTVPASCNLIITPTCLRLLYKTGNYVPQKADVNQLGIAGFLDQFANRADLQTFFEKFRPDALGSNYTTIQINNGGDDQAKPGVEANLDIQYTTGISFPTRNIYYSTGGSPPFKADDQTPTNTNEPYLDWLNYLHNQTTVPQVISISYGDDEQTVPPDYAAQVCDSFAQLGSKGTTVFVASGDYGVGGSTCKTNDGSDKVVFQPSFPASCPFVTTVGGTIRVNPEITANLTGGGFSNYFGQPSYQSSAVGGYLTGIGNQYAGLYNQSGRAYPDIAAQSMGFQVVVGGNTTTVAGTSASTPTVAAIFALINDYLLSQGKSTLGFLNPLIYDKAKGGFNDITSGSNPGCNTTGFSAAAGWDPATGLGTPDFLKLQQLV